MTIKEAQELVEVWNSKHAVHNSELASIALLTERVGELARAVAVKQSEPQHHHHDAPNPPLSSEIGELFWEVLSLCSHAGVELTEALIHVLDTKR